MCLWREQHPSNLKVRATKSGRRRRPNLTCFRIGTMFIPILTIEPQTMMKVRTAMLPYHAPPLLQYNRIRSYRACGAGACGVLPYIIVGGGSGVVIAARCRLFPVNMSINKEGILPILTVVV